MSSILRRSSWAKIVCLPLLVLFAPTSLRAENQVGGHFGFVFPLVSRTGDVTTSIADDFVIGFPMGITIKKTDKLAFDLELVPVIQNDPLNVNLTVHPGVIWGLPNRVGAGIRLAFDIKDSSWGFTPLINKSFPMSPGTAFFTELVLPIRFQNDAKRNRQNSFGFGIHFGVGF